MQVLHYVDVLRLDQGGVVRAVLDLTAELARAGAEVTLLTGDATDAHSEWLENTKPPRVVTLDRTLDPLFRPRKATQAKIERLVADADVVHLHTPWDPVHLAITKAARQSGTPYGVSLHGMLDDWCIGNKSLKKRAYLAVAGRRLLEKAAFVHCTAQAESDQATRWIPRAKPLVAPLVLDLSPYECLPGPQAAEDQFGCLASADEPRLLFLSRVDPKKGVDLLIEAVASLRDTGTPVHAFIAGPGAPDYLESLKRLAKARNVSDRVHFLGMVKGDLKWSLYTACDAFVLPTHQENFGIVLIEAMGCGLPTVTTRSVDIWKELEEHNAVIVNDRVEEVASAIKNLVEDLDNASKRANDGIASMMQWLDPAVVRKQYLDAYSQAIASS